MSAEAKKTKQSGSEQRQRRHRLVVRLADPEWADLVSAAEAEGVSLASYARSRTLTRVATRAVRRPSVDRVLLAQTLAQLGRVGGNLHQLVKHLNFGEMNALRDAPVVVAEVRAAADAIMAALGRQRLGD
jgi:hypothetical protein